MIKKYTKIILSFVIFAMMMLPMPIKVKAATIAISNPGTVQPGETFTVQVSIPNHLGGTVTLSGSNCTVISQNPVMIDGSASFTLRAGSSGAASIYASSSDATVNDGTFQIVDASGSVSFTVASPSTGGSSTGSSSQPQAKPPVSESKPRETRSSNNYLASLSVEGMELSPEFDQETNEYRVEASKDVTSVVVQASAQDEKASVSGTGEHSVTAGENTIEVVVTAEDGSTRTYTVVVVVDETPTHYVEYQDERLGIVRNLNDVEAYEGFEETTVTLDGTEVKAWSNETLKTTVVYLVNENNEKGFYIIEDGKIVSSFTKVTFQGIELYVIEPSSEEELEGFSKGHLPIQDVRIPAFWFVSSNFNDYRLIYAMDKEGNRNYYQLDINHETVQLFSNAAPITMEEYEELQARLKIFEALATVFVILTVVAVGFCGWLFYQKKTKSNIKDRNDVFY